MLNKIILGLLILLFFLLPLVNSHLFDLLGIKWGFYVEGNYEFTKVMFFNIFSGMILSLFFISKIFQIPHFKNFFFKKNKTNPLILPKILLPVTIVLFLSTYFSDFQYTSLFGNNSKSHSFIMFLNIIGLFIIFIDLKKEDIKKIIFTILFSSFFVLIIGIKEYYLPTFNYGNLSNRAISTLGHPNYLALYILILLPLLFKKLANKGNTKNLFLYIFLCILLILFVIVLILTKSVWGILLSLLYLFYILYQKFNYNSSPLTRKIIVSFLLLGVVLLFILVYKFGLITKFSSFISRFYIWETTGNIIFSNIKNFFIGGGLGTLDLVFEPFKVKELYIFENIGFTADRPHNIFINFFYHFGILGFLLISFILYKIVINYKNSTYYHSIILFFLFCLFNFPSINHYLIIILIGGIIYKENYNKNYKKLNCFKKEKILSKYIKNILLLIIFIIAIFGAIFSYQYYKYEYKLKSNNNIYIKNNFVQHIKNEDLSYYLFSNGAYYIEGICLKLTNQIPSVNNYFYCGNILWETDKTIALIYYKAGLLLLPDMWNLESKYYDDFLIKNLFSTKRFYSEKFSNLKEILKRVGEN